MVNYNMVNSKASTRKGWIIENDGPNREQRRGSKKLEKKNLLNDKERVREKVVKKRSMQRQKI